MARHSDNRNEVSDVRVSQHRESCYAS